MLQAIASAASKAGNGALVAYRDANVWYYQHGGKHITVEMG